MDSILHQTIYIFPVWEYIFPWYPSAFHFSWIRFSTVFRKELSFLVQPFCRIFAGYEVGHFHTWNLIRLMFVLLWSASKKKKIKACLVSPVQAGGGSIMVWGKFSWCTFYVLKTICFELWGNAGAATRKWSVNIDSHVSMWHQLL